MQKIVLHLTKLGLSAGRVQSSALKLICDREDEISAFVPEEYGSIEAVLTKDKSKLHSRYTGFNGEKAELKSGEEAQAVLKDVENSDFTVTEVKKGTRIKKALPPFTTSTLQQEASKYLNLTVQKTMIIAQQLYEGVDVAGVGTTGLGS